jgi:hypothetical protein
MDTTETTHRRPRVAPLPKFTQPPEPSPEEPSPESPGPEDPSPTSPAPVGAGGLFGVGTRRPDHERTRTGISSGSESVKKPTHAETTALVVGLVLAVGSIAGAVIRWRTRKELRRPTDGQADRIAAPLARIGLRHLPAHLLNADLMDGISAGAALGVYLNDGPLLFERAQDIPDDLQGAQP